MVFSTIVLLLIIAAVIRLMPLSESRRSMRFSLAEGFARFRWLLAPLLPLLWLYRAVVAIRNFCYDHGICKSTKLPRISFGSQTKEVVVISIGNLSVGGTGKTPATIFLAKALRDHGWRVAIVARGYRRQGSGLVVVSDGQHILAGVAAAGDEPLLLAQKCEDIPVVVDRRKKNAAMAAVEKFSPDLILVDDGFQHRQLHRQIDVVLVDPSTSLGGLWLPSKQLQREPVSALRRAHFVILNAGGESDPEQIGRMMEQCRRHTSAAIFTGKLQAVGWSKLEDRQNRPGGISSRQLLPTTIIKDQSVVLVCGIAHPERFRNLVNACGAQIKQEMILGDHHNYDEKDLRHIANAFRNSNARYILTTAKDAVKLATIIDHRSRPDGASSPLPFLVSEMNFVTEPGFLPAILDTVRKYAGPSRGSGAGAQ